MRPSHLSNLAMYLGKLEVVIVACNESDKFGTWNPE